MKRLFTAALTLSLLGATAAQADPYGYHHGSAAEHYQNRGYDRGGDRGYRHHGNDAGAAIAVGFGLIALTAILAANHDREHDYDRFDRPLPPSAPDYGGDWRDSNDPGDRYGNYNREDRQ